MGMLPQLYKDLEERMKKAVETTRGEFAAIRTGRANSALLDHVVVNAYGTEMPLKHCATISIPDARSIVVSPHDKSITGDVRKAIESSDIGITPNVDGGIIRLVLPPLNEERRKELVSSCTSGPRTAASRCAMSARTATTISSTRSATARSPKTKAAAATSTCKSSPTDSWPMWTRSSRPKRRRSWRCERPACAGSRGPYQRVVRARASPFARCRPVRARADAYASERGDRAVARGPRDRTWRRPRTRPDLRGLRPAVSVTVANHMDAGQRLRQELSLKRIGIGLLVAAVGIGCVFAR